jgi:hypothetical protein
VNFKAIKKARFCVESKSAERANTLAAEIISAIREIAGI